MGAILKYANLPNRIKKNVDEILFLRKRRLESRLFGTVPKTIDEFPESRSEAIRKKVDEIADELTSGRHSFPPYYKAVVVKRNGNLEFMEINSKRNPLHFFRAFHAALQRTGAKDLIPGRYVGDLTGLLKTIEKHSSYKQEPNVIHYDELTPKAKELVFQILKSRRAKTGALKTAAIAEALAYTQGGKISRETLGKLLAGIGIFSLAGYKMSSANVRYGIDDLGKELRKTKYWARTKGYDFFQVNGNEISLLKKSRLKKAVADAQRTALKHLIPAQYFGKIRGG